VTILELAETIARVVGWQGRYVLNAARPDGTPRKLLDVSRLGPWGGVPGRRSRTASAKPTNGKVANAAEAAA